LVEDQLGDAELIAELLNDGDAAGRFALERVGFLRDAVAALPGMFDLILLDLRLPDGEGLDALRQVADAAGLTPTVVLTGMEDVELARACLESGAEDYIGKAELSERTLIRAMDYALARSKAQELRRRLEHSNRLAAIGQLAAGVAHEVNNPAAFILANTNDLMRGVSDLRRLASDSAPGSPTFTGEATTILDELDAMLRDNLSGIERIIELVRDLGVFSRVEDDAFSLVDVAELCRKSANLVAHQVRHRARLELDLRPTPPVAADPRKLGQVVVNLVINAAHAIAPGSIDANTIRIETGIREDMVVMAVTDTGCGISEHLLERIFTPFFSTKVQGEGTGLGLSICAEIVERLGGRIDVTSRIDEGSRFEVLLPVAQGARLAAPGPSIEDRTISRSHARVLLIDDEVSLLRAVGRGLRRHHEVVEASSGERALAILETDRKFDVILCDLMMPGIDGIDVVERLREHIPALAERVVVVSGGAVTPRASDFLAQANLRVLEKPALLRDILDVIDAVLDARADPPETRRPLI
jgi:signal transduction histidine kinase